MKTDTILITKTFESRNLKGDKVNIEATYGINYEKRNDCQCFCFRLKEISFEDGYENLNSDMNDSDLKMKELEIPIAMSGKNINGTNVYMIRNTRYLCTQMEEDGEFPEVLESRDHAIMLRNAEDDKEALCIMESLGYFDRLKSSADDYISRLEEESGDELVLHGERFIEYPPTKEEMDSFYARDKSGDLSKESKDKRRADARVKLLSETMLESKLDHENYMKLKEIVHSIKLDILDVLSGIDIIDGKVRLFSHDLRSSEDEVEIVVYVRNKIRLHSEEKKMIIDKILDKYTAGEYPAKGLNIRIKNQY